MNRHERRRSKAIQKQNKFVNEYVHHLPETTPEALGKLGISHMVFYHDSWCRIHDGGDCNCEPKVRLFAEPVRS